MKTKALLLVCLFLGVGLTQVAAQLQWHTNGKGTGTLKVSNTFEMGVIVFCDNEQVDFLVGTVTFRGTFRFKNNVYWGANEHYLGGDFKSTWTESDEVFKITENDHGFDIAFDGDAMVSGTDIFHFNIIGNKGTHYVGRAIWDIPTQTLKSVIRADCH